VPGPACYGHGGTRATVTDANVVLGRLHGANLLDGRMALHPDLAARAIGALASRLDLAPVDAARGILAVVHANMLAAIRLVSVRKGYDPRDYTLVAFGGAGPLHAGALARDLGIRQVLVPAVPGILCALGLLVEPLRIDCVRTRVQRLDTVAVPDLALRFEEMEVEAHRWLDREAVPPGRRRLVRALDMRYLGQNFELTVAAPAAMWTGDVGALRRAFFIEHERVYGYAAEDEAIQIVNVRLTALGEPDPLELPLLAPATRPDPDAARVAERPVYFAEAGGFVPTPIYRRERLLGGHCVAGPAIVEQMDSTTVIAPGQRAAVDERANLLIDTAAASGPGWLSTPREKSA
jgi:N-methylhydantoinase A